MSESLRAAEVVAANRNFRQIVDAYKMATGGSLGFDPNRIGSPLKVNLAKRAFDTLSVPQKGMFIAALNLELQIPLIPNPDHEVTIDDGGETHQAPQQTTQQTNGATMTAPATSTQPKLSNDALAALGSTLAAALGGFDEGKVRETVRQETKAAVDSVKSALEQAKKDAQFAAQQAESVRVDVNAAKAEVTKMTVEMQTKADMLVKDAIAKALPRDVVVTRDDGKTVNVGKQHKTFPTLLKLVSTGVNVWLPGPAGSGKSTAAHKVAESLSLPFYHQGKVMADFQVLGFIDAGGTYHPTEFRKAYENGGVFLADECDAWAADATLVLNMAIENGAMAFPDKTVTRHKDFLLIAAANTFGTGATADYVGRNKLDGAFLDRFVTLEWEYDESFETILSGNASWASRVQAWRKRAKAKGLKVIISPRASIVGAKLLAAGFSEQEVINMVVRKGMVQEQWNAIQ